MRKPPKRHTLAKLRGIVGLGQKGMADIAGCSCPAIQRIELGELTLSHKLGRRIAFETGINFTWLIENQLKQQPTTADGRYIYTKYDYDLARVTVSGPPRTEAQAARLLQSVWAIFGTNVRLLASLFVYAHRHDKFPICAFKVGQEVMRVIREQVESPEEAEEMIRRARVHEARDLQEEVTKAVADFVTETKKNSHRSKASKKLKG